MPRRPVCTSWDTRRSCRPGHWLRRRPDLAPADATYLHDKEQQLNAELRERAQDAGAGYVDTYKPSVGRDACAGRDTRWIEPLLPSLPAAPMHPNERGARGMADAVLSAVGAPR